MAGVRLVPSSDSPEPAGLTLARERRGAYLPCMSEPKSPAPETSEVPEKPRPVPLPKEIGGAPGPEPTRYGDWEHKGRCTDF